MKHRSLLHGGAMLLAALVPALAAAEGLDGRRFEGVIIERGKTRGDADTISFKEGRFHSSACDEYGYGDAPYMISTVGDTVRFEAVTESPRYGKLLWTGSIRGERLEGTAMMQRQGKSAIENWVVAAEKK